SKGGSQESSAGSKGGSQESSAGGSKGNTQEEDDSQQGDHNRGHGNDDDGVDEDNPAYAKKADEDQDEAGQDDGFGLGAMEEDFASGGMLSGGDALGGSSQDGVSWTQAVESDDYQESDSSSSQNDWTSHIESDDDGSDSGDEYNKLTNEDGGENGLGDDDLLSFENLENFDS
ncbi:MAG: hypothetical protein HQL69_07240, partial [Magnetococcales bacterium]|nr:hypothetical protein [Magnetococcales bacterium]